MNEKKMAYHTGFHLSDYPGSFQLILVAAPVQSIAMHFQKAESVIEKKSCEASPLSCLLFQYSGVPWTLFLNPPALSPMETRLGLPAALSKELATRVLFFEYEDTSAWQGYQLFEDGESVEAFAYGLDYRDEMEEFAEEMDNFEVEDEAAKTQTNTVSWDLESTAESHLYQFRSAIRSATEDQILKGREFLEDAMGFFNAVLPPFELFPYHETIMPKGLEASHFADIVHAHLGVAE